MPYVEKQYYVLQLDVVYVFVNKVIDFWEVMLKIWNYKVYIQGLPMILTSWEDFDMFTGTNVSCLNIGSIRSSPSYILNLVVPVSL